MQKRNSEFDPFALSYVEEINRALPPGAGKTQKYARIKASHIKRQLKKKFRGTKEPMILDAGCGVGLIDKILKTTFPKISGFDISAKSVKLAQRRNPEVRYKVGDGNRFPFNNEEFDVVFAICVLHHIEPALRTQFFFEAKRVLRPGGILMVYEHNPLNPVTRLVVSRCQFDHNAILLFSTETRQLLRKTGFLPEQSDSLIFLPTESPAWRRFEEFFLAKLPFGAQYLESGIKSF